MRRHDVDRDWDRLHSLGAFSRGHDDILIGRRYSGAAVSRLDLRGSVSFQWGSLRERSTG
ncbi:hypothetical protein U1738_19720 [Sphingomonas sp. GB1N7]